MQQVDRCGRRVLFLSSAITTSVPLAAMGTFFYFQRQWGDAEASKSLGWLPLVSLIVFFVTYSGGMSNVPFIIMGEMFPSRFRPLLGAISSSFNLFCLFLTVYFFPDMLKGRGKDGTFYFYTGCTLASVVFVYFLLPETKGKTLEEMELLFESKNDVRNELTLQSVSNSRIINVSNESYYLKDIIPCNRTNEGVVFLGNSETEYGTESADDDKKLNNVKTSKTEF